METTPPSFPHRPDSDEIVLTDRDLVSRYMRYSEDVEYIPYSPERTPADPVSSSPASTTSVHDEDLSNISAISNSTTQTTPLRNDLLTAVRTAPALSPFEIFETLLQNAELPNRVKTGYREQGRHILQIADHLFSRDRQVTQSESTKHIMDLIQATGEWLATALHDAEVQVQNTAYIQKLAPFTVTPGADNVWPIYKQMVELVMVHTKPPSRNMVKVVEALAILYDAYVYQPALISRESFKVSDDVELQLHRLYDAVMSLLMKHQEWCRSMKALNANHMKPALESIISTPIAMQSIDNEEASRQAAEVMLHNPPNTRYRSVSAEIMKVLREKRSEEHNCFGSEPRGSLQECIQCETKPAERS